MDNPLHARYYADGAIQQQVEIVENVLVAKETLRLRFACPLIAQRILPGQFVMVRLAGCEDPLIGRPLALYDVIDSGGAPEYLDVVYLVKGKFTTRLAQYSPKQKLDVWGPLGNGFSPQPADHLILVAGGIGQTPFVAVAREHLGLRQYGQPPRKTPPPTGRVTLCYGARHREYFAGLEDFRRLGVETRLATDDGSAGHHGLVTELLAPLLKEIAEIRPPQKTCIFCCGPEPMMAAVAQIAATFQKPGADIPCFASLETPMACGIGICFTCVAMVRTGENSWDYKRTCVDGPVFNAADLQW